MKPLQSNTVAPFGIDLSKVSPFQLDADLCNLLIGRYIVGSLFARRLDRELNGRRTSFSILELPLNDFSIDGMVPVLNYLLGVELVHLRLHEWQQTDQATEHVDDIHPGCGTLIVRLDGAGPSRLRIAGEMVPEAAGTGYWLPEGTPHQILAGEGTRYTLTGWAKPLAMAKAA